MRWICIFLLKVYKIVFSPFVGRSCIFTPTCSVFAMECYKQFGSVKGTYLTAKRLLRCGPWGKTGFDPIPHNFKGDLKWTL